MSDSLDCFKAYDIRGRVPDQLNSHIAYRIGRASAAFLSARRMVVGHDIRLTSPELCDALVNGLRDGGVDVTHIGQCGTEEIYFATSHGDFDGGIVVTASHNPMDYNGMKFVREESRSLSPAPMAGLEDIKAMPDTRRKPADVTDQRGSLTHSERRCVRGRISSICSDMSMSMASSRLKTRRQRR